MRIFDHRRNTLEELKQTPKSYGVEIDLRSYGRELILQHDPFQDGERFEDWLRFYEHAGIILNVKEEGLEERIQALLAERGVEDYFFLDQSFPFLIRTASRGERRCAARVSEYESVDTAMALSGKIDWIWVDCFTVFPLDGPAADQLRSAGFKLCVVSPELQARNADIEIPRIRKRLEDEGIVVDAVCTKRADLWNACGNL